jgi:uncharacterized protein YbbK (DUF523 family)
VYTKSGKDVTRNFQKGAYEVLRIARKLRVCEAILKQKSPSCGYGNIHDGTFSGKVKKGFGVTAAVLKRNGIRVVTEEEV